MLEEFGGVYLGDKRRTDQLSGCVYRRGPLYFAALAGFNADPVPQLHAYRPFLSLSEWLLTSRGIPER